MQVQAEVHVRQMKETGKEALDLQFPVECEYVETTAGKNGCTVAPVQELSWTMLTPALHLNPCTTICW